jgi:hypothetical protein
MRKQVWWSILWVMLVSVVLVSGASGCISRATYPTGDRPPVERTTTSDAAAGDTAAPDTAPQEQPVTDNKPSD